MLRLIKRHLAACEKTRETVFKCRARPSKRLPPGGCPFHAIGPDRRPGHQGERIKIPLHTSDERLATAKLRDIEREFYVDPAASERIPIAKAVEIFLATKSSTSRDRQRKLRAVLTAMEAYLRTRENITLVSDVRKPHLDAFISTWEKATSTQVREREMMKEFWLYCFTSEIVTRNPAHKVRTIGTKRDHERVERVKTFGPDAVQRILRTADDADRIFARERSTDPQIGKKVQAFVYTLKYSGLALVDVMTLGPHHLGEPHPGKNIVAVEKCRIKTNKLARTSVPVFVAAMLRTFTPESDEYFFWSGNGAHHTRTNKWAQRLKKIFVAADVDTTSALKTRRSGGKLKDAPEETVVSSATPHMFRHTLVRDLYVAGTPVRVIADILGDDPATVTKHYSSFDKLRHETALDAQADLLKDDPSYLRHAAPTPQGASVQ